MLPRRLSSLVFQVTSASSSFCLGLGTCTSKIFPRFANISLNSITVRSQFSTSVSMSTHTGKSETPADSHSVSDSAGDEGSDSDNDNHKNPQQCQQENETPKTKTKGKEKPQQSQPMGYATRNKIMQTQQENVEKAQAKILALSISQKRKLYKCRDRYVTLDNIPTWPEHFSEVLAEDLVAQEWWKRNKGKVVADVSHDLSAKISVFRGDITSLEIDAIVNAANGSLLGGGGVDGAIHSAAGIDLLHECELLNGCVAGNAKISGGYKLPAKHVIHTVGPRGERPEVLQNCYQNSLDLVKDNKLTSVAFPCISTGVFGYPNVNAAKVALKTVRDWLDTEDYAKQVERIIFCLFLEKDVDIYDEQLQLFFPLDRDGSE